MKISHRLTAALSALLMLPAFGWAGQNINVFAAASLKDALDEIAVAYNGEVTISYGGSGLLARQVAQGAPADIVFLANDAWMNWLEERGKIDAESRFSYLSNSLVLIGPEGTEKMDQLSAEAILYTLDGGRLALGHTQGVPAGIYARQWLENTGFWPELQPHLAETESVRSALALVSRKEAPLGVVYGSDALADPGVTVVYEIPEGLHDKITYPAAAIKDGFSGEFLKFLLSDQSIEIFRAHGFKGFEAPQ